MANDTRTPSDSDLTALLKKWEREGDDYSRADQARATSKRHAKELAALLAQRAQPAPSPWQQLTANEQDIIHDALSDAEATALNEAANWNGRKHEAGYLKEADKLSTLRLKLFPGMETP